MQRQQQPLYGNFRENRRDRNTIPGPHSKHEQKQLTTNIIQLQRIYDDYVRLSENLQSSPEYLKNILFQLNKCDSHLLSNSLIINHQIYLILENTLKNVLETWYKTSSLTYFQSFLFYQITKLFIKISSQSALIVKPIRKCLNRIAEHGWLLYDDANNNNMEYFSDLINLYITNNESIMNSVIKCLCSKYYLKMFERRTLHKFLLMSCPSFWMSYKGTQKEEMALSLLNTLLVPAANVITRQHSHEQYRAVIKLLDLLNHSLNLCNINKNFEKENLIPIVNALLTTLVELSSRDQRQPMIKSCIHLLSSLIRRNETALKYVQQRKDSLIKCSQMGVDISFISDYLKINDSGKKSILNDNDKLITIAREHIQHRNSKNSNELTNTTYTLQSMLNLPGRLVKSDFERTVPSILSSSIFASNENNNKEATTLIWYDKNIGLLDDTKKTAKLLQQINDYVLICSNRDECLKYVNNVNTEKIFLIISGACLKDIIDDVHPLSQIDSIYIFCMQREKYEHYLKQDAYNKIFGIYTEHEPLLKAIQENIHQLIKQFDAKQLFDQSQHSIRNLNSQINEFNMFRVFKYVLFQTKYDIEDEKRQMIDICRQYYRGNKIELKNLDDFDKTYRKANAIYWYTKQSFVFRLINQALRTEDYEALLILRLFIIDLSNSLRIKYEDFRNNLINRNMNEKIILYRGLKLESAELYYLKHNIGNIIATNGFLSTTKSKKTAYSFIKTSTKYKNSIDTLFEIEIDLSKKTTPFVDISTYSAYSNEQETLFDFGASFKIKSVIYNETDKLWLVQLICVTEDDLSMYENVQKLLKQFTTFTNMDIVLGDLLKMMGYYRIARNYFQNLLHFYEKRHQQTAGIIGLIANSYELEKEYEKALEYYKLSLINYLVDSNLIGVIIVARHIGEIYEIKEDKVNTRYYFQLAYDILHDNKNGFSDCNCQSAQLFHSMGNLEDELLVKRDYYLKAMNIFQNPSMKCLGTKSHHGDLATVYKNLADTYSNENNDVTALEYLLKCEQIREIHLTTLRERENYIWCLKSIFEIYRKRNDEISMKKYNDKVSEYMDMSLIQSLPFEDHFHQASIQRLYLLEKAKNANISDQLLEHELKTLKFLEKNDPLNYDKIIEVYINIGMAYARTNDYDWAREHYNQAIELCETRINSDEKKADFYYKIGNEFNDIKDYNTTIEYINKSLNIRRTIYSTYHLKIGLCYHTIAVAYDNKLIFNEATNYYKKAIEVYEKHLDDKDDDVYGYNVRQLYRKCHYYVAIAFEKQDEYEKSLEYHSKTLKLLENESLNENERIEEIIVCLHNVIPLHMKHKKYDRALNNLKELKNRLSDNSIELGACYINIGVCYMEQKQYNNAMKNYRLAKSYFEKYLKTDDKHNQENYALCLLNIGKCYFVMDKNQSQTALDFILQGIHICEQYNTENKDNLTDGYDTYAGILIKVGQYNKAIDETNKMLKLQLFQDSSNLWSLYTTLAVCYNKKGNNEQSLVYCKKSIENYKKIHPNDDDDITALLYRNNAECLSRLSRYDEALKYAMSAFKIIKHISSIINYDIAHAHSLLALIYSQLNQYEKSREERRKALDICKQLILNAKEEKVKNLGEIHEFIGEAYRNENNLKRAHKYYKRSLKYLKQDLVDDHPEIKRIQIILNKLSL